MRSRLHCLLLLVLLGASLLEALSWASPPLSECVHRAYPNVGLDREGRVVYYERRKEAGADGPRRFVYILDASRNAPEVLALGPMRATSDLVLTGDRYYGWNLDFDSPRFLLKLHEWRVSPGPLEHLAENSLRFIEAQRRGINAPADTGNGLDLAVFVWDRTRPQTAPIEWRVEDDRLICRETATGRVVAGLGPDGYARGEEATTGERFGRIDSGPLSMRPDIGDSFEWILLDYEGRRLHVVSMPEEQSKARSLPSDSVEPLVLSIDTRPLHHLRRGDPEHETMPFQRIVDRHLLVFLGDGSVVAEVEMEPGERVTNSTGALLIRSEGFSGLAPPPSKPRLATVAVETSLAPVHPDGERRRLRLYEPGKPEIVRDVVLTPTRPSEVALANLTAALALLRPPPLAIASALSPLPAHSRAWWWRDPWLAGGSYPGWLALSIALAAFLAWRARRNARERCATLREVRFWTAAVFLLGPLGLLWMRFVLPRVPVESVGKARRAVNLDASPNTDAPWPEPQPQGIEVFS